MMLRRAGLESQSYDQKQPPVTLSSESFFDDVRRRSTTTTDGIRTSSIFEVNVGGQVFVLGPKCLDGSSFLSSLFVRTTLQHSASQLLRDAVGRPFVDRDPNEFKDVLEYLRTGELPLLNHGHTIAVQLRRTRKALSFYGVVPVPSFCPTCTHFYNPQSIVAGSCCASSAHSELVTCFHENHDTLQYGRDCCDQRVDLVECTDAEVATMTDPSCYKERYRSEPAPVIPSNLASGSRRAADGGKLPLVVNVGIQTQAGSCLELGNTMVPSNLYPQPVYPGACPEVGTTPQALLLTASPQSSAISEIVDEDTEKVLERVECRQSSDGSCLSLSTNESPLPFSLVCRSRDFPLDQTLDARKERVELICDVDLRSLEFSSERQACYQACADAHCSRMLDPTSHDRADYRDKALKGNSRSSSTPCMIPRPDSCRVHQSIEYDTSSHYEERSSLSSSSLSVQWNGTRDQVGLPSSPSQATDRTGGSAKRTDLNELLPSDQAAVVEESRMGACWLYEIQKAQRKEQNDEDDDTSIPTTYRSPEPKSRCSHFVGGRCNIGGNCKYIREKSQTDTEGLSRMHLVGIRDKRTVNNNSNPKHKTKMCPLMKTGVCPRPALRCKYAHTLEELRGTPEFFKTQICSFWSHGHCRAQFNCRHAHGVQELRPFDSNGQSEHPPKSFWVEPHQQPQQQQPPPVQLHLQGTSIGLLPPIVGGHPSTQLRLSSSDYSAHSQRLPGPPPPLLRMPWVRVPPPPGVPPLNPTRIPMACPNTGKTMAIPFMNRGSVFVLGLPPRPVEIAWVQMHVDKQEEDR